MDRGADPRDGIVQFPAIAAEDALDGEVEAAVGTTRNLCPVTASGTFKPIGSAHGRIVGGGDD